MTCPRPARILLTAPLLLLVSCGPQTSGSAKVSARPNVLLISIDSLRADALGCYGAAGDVSPHIDALAAQGVLFEDALSSSSWTLPSHAALFTGLPDSAHGCDSNESRLSPQHETLAEHLSSAGYETAGFWSGPYLHPLFGLAQGFEHYIACTGFEVFGAKSLGDARRGVAPWGEARANARSHQDVTGPRVLEAFETYLDERSSAKPFFAFVHLWDVHYDYIAPTEWRERFAKADYDGPMDGSARAIYEATRGKRPGAPAAGLNQADVEQVRALYAAEVAWTDHHVGALLER
ncbi:MAG: sulfatase, partial [Planctomycetota bacterium]